MRRLFFYLNYAARNLWRSKRWSAFALFSIAAGVATIVALRGLGLSITASLTDNVRESLKGDLTLSTSGRGGGFDFGNTREDGFTPRAIDAVMQHAQQQGWQAQTFHRFGGAQVTAVDGQRVGRPQFVTMIYMNPQEYPLTNDITAVEPSGVPLDALFQGGREIVISENLATSENIRVGDSVRVSGTEEMFVVRGIVPTYVEAGLSDLFASFFGFAYIDQAVAQSVFGENMGQPNYIAVTLPDGATDEAIDRALMSLNDVTALNADNYYFTDSVPEQLEINKFIGDVISRFVVVMGLGAMLIGGIGIINTMLVIVRRRTTEIAAMKTFGLKGRQVAWVFLAEAFLIGLAGSLIGAALGVLLTGFANSFGSAVIQQPLRWVIYPEAIVFGVVIGLIISVVFGVMPVLTAARIRPAIILRPNDTHIAAAGVFTSLLALLLVIVSLGLIAGQIVGNYLVGLITVTVTFIILGLLVLLLWVVVWLLSKIPAFGNVNLKLAKRNLSTRRTRTATTLLALSAGMFALSSIGFFGAAVREILNFTLTETFGGNVLIFPVLPQQIAQPIINGRLNSLEGVEHRTRITNYNAQIVSLNNQEWDTLIDINPEEVSREMSEAFRRGDMEEGQRLSELLRTAGRSYMDLVVRETTNPNPINTQLVDGRMITAADQGKPVAVLTLSGPWENAGMKVGDQLTLDVSGERLTVEIVGIAPAIDSSNFQSALNGDLMLPGGVIRQQGGFALNLAQVQPDKLNEVLLSLSALPLIYSLDISFIDGVLVRLINQFAALPTLVGILSLGAAAVIMANTVALSTLERRRQIGILKAVGLKGGRVLRIMLLENTLVSLVGAMLGIALSALGVWIMTTFGLMEAIAIPQGAIPIAILLIVVAVLIGVIATALSAGAAVRERVLNVLRYE